MPFFFFLTVSFNLTCFILGRGLLILLYMPSAAGPRSGAGVPRCAACLNNEGGPLPSLCPEAETRTTSVSFRQAWGLLSWEISVVDKAL